MRRKNAQIKGQSCSVGCDGPADSHSVATVSQVPLDGPQKGLPSLKDIRCGCVVGRVQLNLLACLRLLYFCLWVEKSANNRTFGGALIGWMVVTWLRHVNIAMGHVDKVMRQAGT